MPSSKRPIEVKNARNAAAGLAILSLVWGYNWVAMKIALQYASPFDFGALRTVLGAVALFLLMWLTGAPLRPSRVGRTVLLGLFQTTIFVGLSCLALSAGAAGKSAVLVFTMPFWVILLAPRFLGEHMRLVQWAACLMALAGLFLILDPGHGSGDLQSSIYAILAGLSWAVGVIIGKKIRVADRGELLSVTAWQMAYGALPLAAIALWVPDRSIEWTIPFLLALIYNILPVTALGWALWLYILQRLSAQVTGLSSLAIPVIGVVAAWLQLNESLEPREAGGIALILLALAVLSIRQPAWPRARG